MAKTDPSKTTPPPIKPPPVVNNNSNSGVDPNDAVKAAQKWLGTTHRTGMCAQFVQESILGGKSGNYDDAKEFYNWAKDKKWLKTSAPPAGVPVFYKGREFGHTAISAGNGYVYTTDAQGNKVGKVPYDKVWGGTGSGEYLGWTGNIRTDRKGGFTHINYDPLSDYASPGGTVTSVNSAKVKVTPTPKAGVAPKPKPKPSPSAQAAPSVSADGVAAGNVNLQSINNPNISKQFSGVNQGNIPVIG